MDLEDVLKSGADNDGGLRINLYYARHSEFTTIQGLPAGTDFSDKMVIDQDHVFSSGNCFRIFECILEKGQLVSNLVGERNSKSFENIITVGKPGNKPELLAFMEEVKNHDLILLVQEIDGQVRQIGSDELPAVMDTDETTSGQATSDFKGSTVTFKSTGRIAPVYTGAISLVPA